MNRTRMTFDINSTEGTFHGTVDPIGSNKATEVKEIEAIIKHFVDGYVVDIHVELFDWGDFFGWYKLGKKPLLKRLFG